MKNLRVELLELYSIQFIVRAVLVLIQLFDLILKFFTIYFAFGLILNAPLNFLNLFKDFI